jgi:hypothetical protein
MENIWVSFGVSAKDYFEAAKKYLPKGTKPELTVEHLESIGGNYTYYKKPDKDGLHWIWVKDKNDISCLAHEVFHLTYTVLDIKGIQLCDSSEEVFAYLTGWLFKLITK